MKRLWYVVAALLIFIGGCSKQVSSEMIQEKLALGTKYLLEENYEEALLVYQDIIEIDKKVEEAYKGISNIFVIQGNPAEAETIIEEGIKAVDDKNSLRVHLAEVYEVQEKNEEAIELYQEIIDEDSRYLQAYIGLSNLYYSNDDVADMIAVLEEAINQDPENPAPYLLVAEAYESIGDRESAISYIKDAHSLDPSYYLGYEIIEQLFNGNWEELARLGDSVLAEGMAAGAIWKQIAKFHLEQYEEVVAIFEDVEVVQGNVKAITLTALAELKLDHAEKATELLAGLNIGEIEDITVLKDLVQFYQEAEETDLAVELAEKALIIDETAYSFYLYLFELTDDEMYIEQLSAVTKVENLLYKEAPEISDQEVSTLYPGTEVLDQKTISFGFVDYTVLALAATQSDEWFIDLEIAIVSYDRRTEKWQRVWESSPFELYEEFDNYLFGELLVTNPNPTNALIGFAYNFGGSSGHHQIEVLSLDYAGLGSLRWSAENFRDGKFDIEDNAFVIVNPQGQFTLQFQGQQFTTDHIPRSELAPADSKELLFTVRDSGRVIAANEQRVTVNKGETIAVVPADQKAKDQFDGGELGLYIGDASTMSLAHVNYWYTWNSVTLHEPGWYHIVLESRNYDYSFGSPEPTFIIEVIDGSQTSNGRAESTLYTSSRLGISLELPNDFYNDIIIEEIKRESGGYEVESVVFYYLDETEHQDKVFLSAIERFTREAWDDYFSYGFHSLLHEESNGLVYAKEEPGESPYIPFENSQEQDTYFKRFDQLGEAIQSTFKVNR
ncbi:tetratricopeptide repeat protein [Halalkalibacter alkaliphilus]|uniref:Tetratricopeptide repeat protein n=1 Tax=Halalkalibacter alkaliphilus TaxID=2917993 RepID=A0A9X2CTQ9_9BACI|nr:tetratricopeptide repeat protein [Halalkalibacter alkaliphilus]MCL7748024.1 tetratricopeptide repeat protein [Halalkalibacter alkaliphilus]